MITTDYICSLYRYAYEIINFAEQDNIRGTFWEWVEGIAGADVFHDDICRALAVDTNARIVYPL